MCFFVEGGGGESKENEWLNVKLLFSLLARSPLLSLRDHLHMSPGPVGWSASCLGPGGGQELREMCFVVCKDAAAAAAAVAGA